jgi:hypothetical protein
MRPPVPPPPKANDDPYNFRKPARAQTTSFAGGPTQSPPYQKPKPPPRQYAEEAPASAGAAKMNNFARAGNQQWNRAKFEEASRAEASRSFSSVRPGQQTPDMPPPRPPRQHPTAPRPTSSEMPNGINPGFPGMSRTASGRRPPNSEELRSAYAHVNPRGPQERNGMPPPRTRPSASPLRHTKSSEYAATRPGMNERTQSRYGYASGEKTELNPGLSRSSSVRNSPISPQWEEPDSGPFGRPHSDHQSTRRRHRSLSPGVKRATRNAANDYSDSDTADDDPIYMGRAKTAPSKPPSRVRTQDGLDSQASLKNYTRVVHDDASPYVYPAPEPKQPARAPFPNMTSPNDTPEDRNAFRYAFCRYSPNGPRVNGFPSWAVPSTVSITSTNFYFSGAVPTPDPVFRPANFQHHDWAEKLRSTGSTSPSRRNQKSRSRAQTTTRSRSRSQSVEPNDVEMGDATPPQPNTNGVGVDDLNDLKDAGPFGPTGLNGVDDLRTNLPFPSKASASVPHEPHTIRAWNFDGAPKPPKTIMPPDTHTLNQNGWHAYTEKMKRYVADWVAFERGMTEHFAARQKDISERMHDNWLSMLSDGPKATECDNRKGSIKAGYSTYMDWFEQDKALHVLWNSARDRHEECMEELGRIRCHFKDQANGSTP